MSTSTASSAVPREVTGIRRLRPRIDLPGLAAWSLSFGLLLVMAFENGGYGPGIRGQVGIAAWWILAMGVVAGVLSVRTTRSGWIAFGVLGCFAAWTALALEWTESQERTWIELGRLVSYLGVLGLALAAARRVHVRHLVNGAAAAIVVVAAAAVLARLEPSWIGSRALYEVYPEAQNRLAWPLGYWNLLAGLAAMGIPLLLAAGGSAKTTTMRALSVGVVPVLVLCAYLTISRGGVLFVAVGVLAWLAVSPERAARLAHLAVAAAGSGLLIAAADRRDALQSGQLSALSSQQGDELLGLVLLVIAGCTLLAAAVALVDRHVTPPAWLSPSRRHAVPVAAVACALTLGAFFAAGGASFVDERWTEFKGTAAVDSGATSDPFSRLSSATSNGRYQYWVAARDAQQTAPWQGIGPGTYEYWYARTNPVPGDGFIRDAHSLWFQTLAETGWIGAALILGFAGFVLIGGAVRAVRSRDRSERLLIAGAVGGFAAFAATASLEWAWQMGVIPAAALVLAAAAIGGRGTRPLLATRDGASRWPVRLATVAAAAVALCVIAIPTAGTGSVRASQEAARAGDLNTALIDARTAADLQPYSASAHLQQALVLERAGQLEAARLLAARATREEPTNWRTWLVLSRLQTRTGDAAGAVGSFREARRLNPDSPLLAP